MSPRLIGLDGKVAAPKVGALWRANGVAIFAVLSLLALGVPAAYFALGYSARSASLEVKAELKAELISGSIHRSPQTWRFEEHRLLDKLTREPLELEDEKGSIVDAAGHLITSSDSVLPAPVIERSATLFEAGLATPVTRALAEGQVSAFSGKGVVLLRHDGTALAIEDSAAPLRNHSGDVIGAVLVFRDVSANSEGFLEFIHAQALLHRLPPGAVCFEVTETTAISNMAKASAFMRAAKSLGFTFALDDFGVGTSSLAYLKTLPVDYLKIDGSFIRNIIHDPIDRAMADTINRVGHIMGLQTVGEYAESDLIIEELRSIGVDFAQGYGVQRPQPLPEHLLPAELPPAYEATTLASTV